ncbi:MAG TPA: ATP-binding protein [Isosphaeraceae bacterium]|jgi:type II secretory pathway predicted ATPase ExeA|nr:ATP-binding protein [Isosphaeraceae bacterium]
MPWRHWRLEGDPFADAGSAFVATPAHVEATERLAFAVEAAERLAVLEAPAGLGKSVVLARAFARAKGPSRRLARVVGPADGDALATGLAEALGRRVSGRDSAWRRLAEALRLCRAQRLAVTLAIDDAHALADPDAIDRLLRLDPAATLLLVGRGPLPEAPWSLRVRLAALTRSEADLYLSQKLTFAGRPEPTFTPRAVTLLHSLSAGNPRGLDRLAALSLLAGSARRLEIITPDVVEGVAGECVVVS